MKAANKVSQVRVNPYFYNLFGQPIITPKDFGTFVRLGLRIKGDSAFQIEKLLDREIQLGFPETARNELLIEIRLIKKILEKIHPKDLDVHNHEIFKKVDPNERVIDDLFRRKILINRLVHPEDVEAVFDNI